MTTVIERAVMEFIDANPAFEKDIALLLVPPSPGEARDEFPDTPAYLLENPWEQIKPGITRLAFYVVQRRDGASANWAEITATQQCARVDTDAVFFSGLTGFGEQMSENDSKRMVKASQRLHGFTPPPGAIYFSSLAQSKGDPAAYVTRSQGRSYIKKLIESRGGIMSRDGEVTWRQPESDPFDSSTPIASDLLEDAVQRESKKNPGKKVNRKELREKVIAEQSLKVS